LGYKYSRKISAQIIHYREAHIEGGMLCLGMTIFFCIHSEKITHIILTQVSYSIAVDILDSIPKKIIKSFELRNVNMQRNAAALTVVFQPIGKDKAIF